MLGMERMAAGCVGYSVLFREFGRIFPVDPDRRESDVLSIGSVFTRIQCLGDIVRSIHDKSSAVSGERERKENHFGDLLCDLMRDLVESMR